MNRPLQILHLEDEADYSDLVQDLISQEVPSRLTRVSTRTDFEAALAGGPYDLILADYLLPDFDGLSALQIAHQQCPETPFLILSGTMAETEAIETVRRGATDYVLKALPERLLPAVKRAVAESVERTARRNIERELKQNERHFQTFTENVLDVLMITNAEGNLLYSSPSLNNVLGFGPAEVRGRSLMDLVLPSDLETVKAHFGTLRDAPANTLRFDLTLRHKDGTTRELEAVAENRLTDPEIEGIVLTAHDVTEKRRAERELRESEQQYRLIFDGNPNPMWIFDQETLEFLEVNDAAVQHYGYSREEFRSMRLSDLRTDSEDPSPEEYLHRLVPHSSDARLGYAGKWKHVKRDGSVIHVEVKWAPIRFKGRNASLTLINDVTERWRDEKRDSALSKLGQSLNATSHPTEAAQIIRSITDELFTWDVFTLNLYLADSDELLPLVNLDTDRSGNRFEVVVDGGKMAPGGLTRRAIQHGGQLILRPHPAVMGGDSIAIGDKAHASASLMLVPIRNRTKVIGVLSLQSYKQRAYNQRDLQTLQTLADHCGGAIERIRAEQALRESEMRFRELFEGSPDAIFVQDLNGYLLDVNLTACKLHAASREDLIGRHISQLVPESKRAAFASAVPLMASGRLKQIETSSLTWDGAEVPVEISGNRVSYAGKPALLLHVRDISERRRSEEELRSSEMLFHSVWENSVDGMRLTDRDGVVVAVNEAFCRIVGMPRDQIEGKLFTVPYATSENHDYQLKHYRETFAARIVDKQVERRLRLKSGAALILEDTSSYVERKGKEPLLLCLFRDVTAQRKLEEQLRQSQKMEAIGLLAGGVAHDFNNILTVIHGHASLLATQCDPSSTATRSAQQILQAAERAAGLTRQLLTFGRRTMIQPRRLDVNELLANMTKMLGRILGEDIALKLQYSAQPSVILADAGMIEQVLLNLAVNSRDAMPKGGVLFLKTSIQEVSGTQLLEHPDAASGRYVCLSAVDTGCGIPPENLKRIFEPFFTTKPTGKGTGLGLATVYGIVDQHQGWIEVDSGPNQGAEFRIYLPYRAEQVDRPDETNSTLTVRGGRETILVVEDEEPVRELVCSVLLAHGYRILKAESGPKALEVWRTSKKEIDLLLTDIVMPEQMTGRELAEKLLAERPDLKVIFTSGYSADSAGKDCAGPKNAPFLPKPYHPGRLVKTVRECLDTCHK